MDWSKTLLLTAFLVAASSINGARGYTLVTGTVFCDQCKDGQISLFDYPLNGIKVTMACPGSDGKLSIWREETSNWLGNYAMRFDGTPDLRGCYAQVSGNGQGSTECAAAFGPANNLRLMFSMFDMEIYNVDPLLAQPAQPMSLCPTSAKPPLPFLEASACSHKQWMIPEHRCYWKVVSPDTKVALVFGVIAGRKYGTEMTLWQGMNGRGDLYRTLLREGTTALLNSYNSILFPYNSFSVIQHMNWALLGSTRQILHTALGFMKANSGIGISNATCRFTACN